MDKPLSLADQVFVNAMAVLASSPHFTPEHAELALYRLRQVMPQITRGHPILEPIAEQADIMLGCGDVADIKERRARYGGARLRAASKLGDFFFWRMGLVGVRLDSQRKGAA